MPDAIPAVDAVLRKRAATERDLAVLILGPGASADAVDRSAFAKFLVVAVNDAELIYPGDICVYSGDWVADRLSREGPTSSLYVTSADAQQVVGGVMAIAETIPSTEEASALSTQRLVSGPIVVEDALFLTALQIATRMKKLVDRSLDVYMVGFDFDSSAGYSRYTAGGRYRREHPDRLIRITGHNEYFSRAVRSLAPGGVNVIHVGDLPLSEMSAAEFNNAFGEHVNSSSTSHEQGGVAIVAELTTNHFGDRHQLAAMIRSCAAAGADYVKLQKRDVATFYTTEQLESPYSSPFGDTFGDYRRGLELVTEDFEFVERLTRRLGIQWFASVLDPPSYEFMRQFDLPLIKLPSTISNHRNYLRDVGADYEGPIVLSTGMTDASYESFVVDTFGRNERVYLLQCNSGYPTPIGDCNVGVVAHYADLSRTVPAIVPGYSSHDPGWFASALAVAAGARMVEKHVKMGNTEWAHFDVVALDLEQSEFRDYVSNVRLADVAMGDGFKRHQPSEHHKY